VKARRAARILSVVALLGLGCGPRCGCAEGDEVLETLDGPVKVELVRQTRWTGGRLPGPISTFYVRVHTNPPFDEWVECHEAELAGDEEGKAVAFRCADAPTWTVLRPVRALGWAAVIASELAAADAGALACEQAADLDFRAQGSRLRAETLALILGATKTPCPALSTWFEQVDPCRAALCRRPTVALEPCTDQELVEEAASPHRVFVRTPNVDPGPGYEGRGPVRSGLYLDDPARAVLAALHVTSTIDTDLRRRIARVSYERVRDATLPACREAPEPGTPCHCTRVVNSEDICAVPAAQTRGGPPPCTFVIDDEARKVSFESPPRD
jgi:hypothetical protein